MTNATFRNATFSGYTTGVLDLSAAGRRILSLPSQLGCTVGCTFCVSRHQPLIRNLQAAEMLSLVDLCLLAEPLDARPTELSFTGEGEPLLNWKQTQIVAQELADRDIVQGVRYCLSGLGADKLLPRIDTAILPTRLQVSLHAARQGIRDILVPNSILLSVLAATLRDQADRFVAIELNVVLQDGVNDSDEDLQALVAWGDSSWPILLNPQLTPSGAKTAARSEYFAKKLRDAGRDVRVYSQIAAKICDKGIYPKMTARPLQFLRKIPEFLA